MKNVIDIDSVSAMKPLIQKRYEHLMANIDSILDEKNPVPDFKTYLDFCLAVGDLMVPLNILDEGLHNERR